ncbi:TM2 domain-containing protein [Gordonia sp. OPL2]|uniref:TM2 domain-containing protein n=1 Tax=Gordonia sp. OPL2 TaxID=2486274 RepID=UPI001654D95A|nr:TM2 domain-containing protein [Gordonia sp. OPL2]ROZ87352.1 NINE protein [Gordonia sp. OPL2]
MSYPGHSSDDPYRDPRAGTSGDPYGQATPYSQPNPYGDPYGNPAGYGPTGQPYGVPQGGQPYGGQPYVNQPYGGQPYANYGNPYGGAPGMDPSAPFGRDPMSGLPYSDKSKIVAGLLQIFLGTFGVGRFYLGDNQTGGIQLGLTILGWITVVFIVGLFILMGVGLWALIDGIMMLTGSVRDRNGLPLRS